MTEAAETSIRSNYRVRASQLVGLEDLGGKIVLAGF